jgi:hypothetical protein
VDLVLKHPVVQIMQDYSFFNFRGNVKCRHRACQVPYKTVDGFLCPMSRNVGNNPHMDAVQQSKWSKTTEKLPSLLAHNSSPSPWIMESESSL